MALRMRAGWLRMGALVGLGILIAGTIAAYAATNTIPNTRLDIDTRNITANDLILGSAGNDSLQGLQGSDCLLGGDGDDTLFGSTGGDVLLAGNGADSLNGGQGTDVCDGEGGTDSGSPTCETELNIP